MTPALARIKQGVRTAITWCGGVDGAGATTGRCRSVAGDWMNLNHKALPPLDAALALDEIAVAQGKAPPIATAYARELGGVFVALPDMAADAGTIPGLVMELAAEFGDLSRAVSVSLDDGIYEPHEAQATLDQLHRLEGVCARLRGALGEIERSGAQSASGKTIRRKG